MNRWDRSLGQRTALMILRWYPRGWRDRYGYEMGQILSTHRVTVATVIDLLVAALDAHLHRLPESTPTGSRRLLGAQVRLFGVWLLFGLATMALLRVRDPLPQWRAATATRPALRTVLDAVQLSALVSAVGLASAMALLVVPALWQQWRVRRRQLLLTAVRPAVVLAALIAYVAAARPAWRATRPDLTAGLLQIGFLVLVAVLLATIVHGLHQVCVHASPSPRQIRRAARPTTVAVVAMFTAAAATAGLGLLCLGPAAPSSAGQILITAVVMLTAALLATPAARRTGHHLGSAH